MELFVAVVAVVVSVTSVLIAVLALRQQRRHDELSVRPIAEITGDNYEAHLVVRLSNYGTGPLVVRRVRVTSAKTEEAPSLYDCMQDVPEPACITYWAINLTGRAVPPGAEVILIRVEGPNAESERPTKALIAALDRAREDLSETKIEVHYADIYGNEMPVYSKKLSLFEAET